eukprot:452712_1
MSTKECSPGVQKLLRKFNLQHYNQKMAQCGYSSRRDLFHIPYKYKEDAVSKIFQITDTVDKIKMLTVINTIHTESQDPVDAFESSKINIESGNNLVSLNVKRKFSELDTFDNLERPPKRQRKINCEDAIVEATQLHSDSGSESEDGSRDYDDDGLIRMTESDESSDESDDDEEESWSEDSDGYLETTGSDDRSVCDSELDSIADPSEIDGYSIAEPSVCGIISDLIMYCDLIQNLDIETCGLRILRDQLVSGLNTQDIGINKRDIEKWYDQVSVLKDKYGDICDVNRKRKFD